MKTPPPQDSSTRAQSELAVLDGLRGLAAFAVVLMHASVLAQHAYLAVDLFFVLSGFVLEHAYGARLAQGWSPGAFLWKRVRRLYPLYALGLLISLLAVGSALLLHRGAGWTPASLAAAALTGAVMAPLWSHETAAPLYPLNFPAWTLLAELAANAVYALAYRRLSQTVLIVWTAASAVLLGWLVLGYGGANAGATWPTLGVGMARVVFAFPLGVLLRRVTRGALPSAWGLPILAAACVFLYAPAPANPLYDLLAVLIAWPLLIAAGARCQLKRLLRAVAVELGAASYGVYVTAVPVYVLVHAVLKTRGLTTDTLPWPQALLFCLALFGAAFAVRRLVGRRPAGAY